MGNKANLIFLAGVLAVVAQQPCDQLPCSSQFNPVCGSDGKVYQNECEQVAANCRCGYCMTTLPVCQRDCENQSSQLSCGIMLDNACTITTCGEYKGEDPCYKNCGNDFEPVCASDYRTYENQCSFEKANCLSGNTLTIVSTGRCPARTRSAFTSFDAYLSPSSCARECTMVYSPVCASDGNTYSNQCVLEVAACQSGGKIAKLSDGQCPDTVEEVRYKMAPQRTLDLTYCEKSCPLSSNYVCASNGKSYYNQCFFEISNCRSGGGLVKAADGLCPTLSFPSPTNQRYSSYNPVSRSDSCKIMCSLQYSPVCGSDGRTYANTCMMSLAACENRRVITEARYGECDDIQVAIAMVGTQPEAANETETGEEAQWAFDCERECKAVYVPVCGNDGHTYPNECAFSIANCVAGGVLKATTGACPEVGSLLTQTVNETQSMPADSTGCKIQCTNELAPVCGNDGMTYMNDCLLSVATCRTGGEVTKAADGQCRAVKNTTNQCSVPCNSTVKTVCGSNGITYESECKLLAASCKTKVAIRVEKEGPCIQGTADAREKPTLPYSRCRTASECANVIGGNEEDWVCTDPMVCRPAQCTVNDNWKVEWCGPSQCSKTSATLDKLGYCRPINA